jgi:hypothetical protein
LKKLIESERCARNAGILILNWEANSSDTEISIYVFVTD